MQILASLEQAINDNGPTVTKEYVKGRKNLTANPAINEYNKTATAANGTVSTLINIMEKLGEDEGSKSKLADLFNSLNDD